jgi:hypothetical protein
MYSCIRIGLKAKNSVEEEERKERRRKKRKEKEIIVFPDLLYLDKTIFVLCLAY